MSLLKIIFIHLSIPILFVCCFNTEKETNTETNKKEIIYSDTSIVNGIVVIAEDKELNKGDTLNLLIGLENKKQLDSLFIFVDGRKLLPNSNGWTEHAVALNHWGRLFLNIRSSPSWPIIKSKRHYEIVIEVDFSIEKNNGNLLYRNEKNAIEIYIEDYCTRYNGGPRLKVKNGKLVKFGSLSYYIKPDVKADSCFVNLKYCGFEKNYVYLIVDKK